MRLRALRSRFDSGIGRRLRPLMRWSYSRLLTSAGMFVAPGTLPIDPGKPTVLVVSHEASTTGAPILALNLCQHLAINHNVIVLLLKGGDLRAEFRASATALIQARRSFVNQKLIQRALARASRKQQVQFALVNSVASAAVLEPLRSQGIACLCLVHEFVTYIKPLEIFSEVGLWASRVVCSTPLTWRDVLRHCRQLIDVPVAVLPQGRCNLPSSMSKPSDPIQKINPERNAELFLKHLPETNLLVLGAGAVQPRKGVDLFVATAQQILLQAPELPVQFAWIGSGYDPDHDLAVSVWLKDQIERSGLSDHLAMLDESVAYSALVKRSDLFVVSSRLDPLPNVAIDAMLAGTPVLCFEEACGIASLMEQEPELHSSCVAPYFDTKSLARKAVALLRSPERRKLLGALTLGKANGWFQMQTYAHQLMELARISRQEIIQEQRDLALLQSEQVLNSAFCFPDQRLSNLKLHQRYLLSWRRNIHGRKPFPGFHPGIYREQQLPSGSPRDPLAHWLEQGRPCGPWSIRVIADGHEAVPRPPAAGEVALHIHVFYPELLAPILERLAHNQVTPDLYISYSDPALLAAIRQVLSTFNQTASLYSVPNRGRDIGPLLSELGQHLDQRYRFHGHLHTKKSVLIDGGTAARWREFLLINLLGDAQRPMADQILSAMQADPQLGLVFPDDPGCLGWTQNRSHAEVLAQRLQLRSLPDAINFPVGTMFWARQGALTSLYNLELKWEDYPQEPLGYDGTMLHAIERLLPQVCLASGQNYAVTNVPGFSR